MYQLLVWSSLLLGLLINNGVLGLNKEDLYPYGINQRDRRLEVGDDLSANEFRLATDIAFYDSYHSSIFVSFKIFYCVQL